MHDWWVKFSSGPTGLPIDPLVDVFFVFTTSLARYYAQGQLAKAYQWDH